jgi:hypothetical protein
MPTMRGIKWLVLSNQFLASTQETALCLKAWAATVGS